MSGDIGIGRLIEGFEQRDAIHIAVAPATAGCDLYPGQGVRHNPLGEAIGHSNPIGIVDPFLKDKVRKGQRFWMFLNPGSITSLRHDWTHPEFKPEPEQAKVAPGDKVRAGLWLKEFAQRERMDFGRLADIMKNVEESGEAWCGDDDNQESFNDQKAELIHQWEVYTGRPMPHSSNDVYFSCAC